MSGGRTRLAVDIGGTFTDIVLERDGELTTHKILTTPLALAIERRTNLHVAHGLPESL